MNKLVELLKTEFTVELINFNIIFASIFSENMFFSQQDVLFLGG